MRRALRALKTVLSAFFSTSSRSRYESRHALLRGVAELWGFRVYNKNLCWFRDEEYRTAWGAFPEANDKVHERRFVLYQLAKSVASLKGDTVECGVFNGGGSHLICYAKQKHGQNGSTQHFVFDSFEGLSPPSGRDEPETATSFQWQEHDLSVPEERVRENLKRFEGVRYLQGWIPDRFAEVSDRRFSLAHVDVDLYQPTKDSIEFFYPRMVPYGLLICDDYGFDSCPGAYSAFNEFMENKPESIIHLTTGQAFIIKQPTADVEAQSGDVQSGDVLH